MSWIKVIQRIPHQAFFIQIQVQHDMGTKLFLWIATLSFSSLDSPSSARDKEQPDQHWLQSIFAPISSLSPPLLLLRVLCFIPRNLFLTWVMSWVSSDSSFVSEYSCLLLLPRTQNFFSFKLVLRLISCLLIFAEVTDQVKWWFPQLSSLRCLSWRRLHQNQMDILTKFITPDNTLHSSNL